MVSFCYTGTGDKKTMETGTNLTEQYFKNSFVKKSSELFDEYFDENFTEHFCELVATALLGSAAYNLWDGFCNWSNENWFFEQYDCHNFNYIITVSRKGTVVFQAYLRTIKDCMEEALDDSTKRDAAFRKFQENAAKTTLTNTRMSSFYIFKKTDKILIFDDLLEKGRNFKRIAESFLRLGIAPENIYYSALGYHSSQKTNPNDKKEDDKKESVQSTWISRTGCPSGKQIDRMGSTYEKTKYAINIVDSSLKNLHKKESDDVVNMKYTRLNLFLPYSLADEYFLSSCFFHDKHDMNYMSFNFNKFLHNCLIPYTGYMPYGYLMRKGSDEQEADYLEYAISKIFTKETESQLRDEKAETLCVLDLNAHKMKILACENINDSIIFNCEYNFQVGFYSNIKIFRSRELNEIILYPHVYLPKLNEDKIRDLYCELLNGVPQLNELNDMIPLVLEFARTGVTSNKSYESIPLDFEEFTKLSVESEEEKKYASYLKKKNVYEHMSRTVISVLSAIEGMKFINKHSLFGDDEDNMKSSLFFATTLFMYIGANRRGINKEREEKLTNDFARFLRSCYENVHEAGNKNKLKEIFDFENMTADYEKPFDEWIESEFKAWKSCFTLHSKDNKELENAMDRTAELMKKYACDKRSYFSIAQKRMPRLYLLDIMSILSDIDDALKTKLPPIPTFTIVKIAMEAFKKCNESNLKEIELRFREQYEISNFEDALYVAFMSDLQSLLEDASVSAATYVENGVVEKSGGSLVNGVGEIGAIKEDDSVFDDNYLQCAEMTMHFYHELMEEYGGWAIVNEFRSVYFNKLFEKNKNFDENAHIESFFKKHYKDEYWEKLKDLEYKRNRLFENKNDNSFFRNTIQAPDNECDQKPFVGFMRKLKPVYL